MIKLVLLRHGESIWNHENRFTGWTDVDLSECGRFEAKHAGQLLKKSGYAFDRAYTSVLKRAIWTLWLTLDQLDQVWLPIEYSWRLNERHYGALQGLNKAEIAKKYGEEQIRIWRRSYDVRPPLLERTDPRFPGYDPRYKYLGANELPLGESLRDTIERFMPYWYDTIAPNLVVGQTTIIVAHGNTLRALIKHLDHVPDDKIENLEIPTGTPLVYELETKLEPIAHYYVGAPEGDERSKMNWENNNNFYCVTQG